MYNASEIQIVAFASPFPANYGGIIDVYYKIKAFQELGIKIHLHTFLYDEHKRSPELEKTCASVHYYDRVFNRKYIQGWPYIVASRYNKSLIENVKKIGHPVLLEGLHTCFFLEELKSIPHVIRMHNIEWKYYIYLAELEKSFLKKKYFLEEAKRLKSFEKNIEYSKIISISENDKKYLRSQYPLTDVDYIPPFHQFNTLEIQTGKGDFALFHGNLSVNENEDAAIQLIEKVFLKTDYPLFISGKNPSEKLKIAAKSAKNIQLIENPSISKMTELMKNAQIHLIPNRQPTGIKIKWINALYTARNIIVHSDICQLPFEDNGIINFSNIDEIIHVINILKDRNFNVVDIEKRKDYVQKSYNNTNNIKKLLQFWGI